MMKRFRLKFCLSHKLSQALFSSPYNSYRRSGEKLLKYHENLNLTDRPLILQKEIGLRSPLSFKRVKSHKLGSNLAEWFGQTKRWVENVDLKGAQKYFVKQNVLLLCSL